MVFQPSLTKLIRANFCYQLPFSFFFGFLVHWNVFNCQHILSTHSNFVVFYCYGSLNLSLKLSVNYIC